MLVIESLIEYLFYYNRSRNYLKMEKNILTPTLKLSS